MGYWNGPIFFFFIEGRFDSVTEDGESLKTRIRQNTISIHAECLKIPNLTLEGLLSPYVEGLGPGSRTVTFLEVFSKNLLRTYRKRISIFALGST